jgi:hypothetical protein
MAGKDSSGHDEEQTGDGATSGLSARLQVAESAASVTLTAGLSDLRALGTSARVDVEVIDARERTRVS